MAQPAFKYVQTDAIVPATAQPFSVEAHRSETREDNPVAVLQAMILQRFSDFDAGKTTPLVPTDQSEAAIAFVSRWGGVAVFVAAFAGCALAIF